MEGDGGAGLILHGPDVADDGVAAELLGADDAADGEGGQDAVALVPAELRDDLGDIAAGAEEGDHDVLLVHTGEVHQGVTVVNALALQQLPVAGVAVDDAGGRQEVREEGAGIRVLLDDLDGDAAAEEPLGKVEGDAPAAAEDDPVDLPGGDAEVFQHPGKIIRRGGDEEAVPRLQDEAAVRRHGHAPAQHGAHQHPALDEVVELVEGHALQAASFRYLQLCDLHPAPGEGLPLEKAGVLQKPVDLGGGLLVRIHGEGEGEGLPHLIDLVGVVGVPDAGDGVDVLIQPVGAEAAEEVDLILAGGGDEEVRVGDAGLAQDLHRGAVAPDSHHVEAL